MLGSIASETRPDSPGKPAARSGQAVRSLAMRLFPDYSRGAIAYWSGIVAAGALALAAAIAQVAALPLAQIGHVALIACVAALVGLFPLQIPRTKNSIAAGDIFIFLMLLLHGPFAAALAAACEVGVAALRTSRRWSSWLVGPASAALAMLACGYLYQWTFDGLLRATASSEAAVLGALLLFTIAYFVVSPTLVTTVLYLKRRRRPTLREWFDSFGWLGMGYAASASVAGVLFLAFRQFGIASIVVAVPMIGMFLATLHHYFSQQEAAEREVAERLARERAEAAERAAAQAAEHLRQLADSDRRFQSAFDHAAIGMALVAPGGEVLQCNRAMAQLLARTDSEVVGQTFRSFVNPFDSAQLDRELQQLRDEDSEGLQIELRVRRPDGREAWASLHCSPFSLAGGAGLIFQAFDITSRRQAEARLQHMAYHDGLTNLANRSRLHEALAQAIDAHRNDPAQHFGVMYLAFEGYRAVNDSLGLVAGDQFLVKVARRLKEQVGPGDLVARVGGNEFAILTRCEERCSHTAIALANRLHAALSAPLALEEAEVATGMHVGITFCDVGYLNPEEALRDADLARQKARVSGKAEPAIFDPNLHERAKEKLLLEAALRRAIAANQLSLAFQPIFDLQSRVLVGFEALARWEHPERGAVSPVTFIRVAEESGLIGALTQWAIGRACLQLRLWRERAAHCADLFVNVNISGHDLCDAQFAGFVDATLRQHQLPPAALTLEITENTLMQQLDRGGATLARLHELGVGLSVDDFGTGYSSLSYLSTLPISSLKIDRSFVSRLAARADDAEIVRAVIQLGDALGKRVVAEGIESAAQLERLRHYGCELGQGYHFSRPLTAQLATSLLDSVVDGRIPASTSTTSTINGSAPEGAETWQSQTLA